jgi:hypothetical protein
MSTTNYNVTLDMLPNELLHGILEYISPPCLNSVNLVNWHLYKLTLEHLYAAYAGPDAVRFLRTIALPTATRQFGLAERVKRVEWNISPFHQLRASMSTSTTSDSISASDKWAIANAYRDLALALPCQQANPLDIAFARHTRSDPETNHWFFEFFLSFMPNVQDFHVNDAWQWDDHTYWFTNIAANASRYQHLKTISIEGPMRIENIIPLLSISSLRNLDLEQVIVMRQEEDREFAWHQPNRHVLQDASCGLERLALRASYLPTDSIVSILKAIKGLRFFTYEHIINGLSHPLGATFDVDYTKLAAALSKHAPTLTDLCLGEVDGIHITNLKHFASSTPLLQSVDMNLLLPDWQLIQSLRFDKYDVENYLELFMPRALQTLKIDLGDYEYLVHLFHYCRANEQIANDFARGLAHRGLKTLHLRSRADEVECKMYWAVIRNLIESAGIDFVAVYH